MNLQVCKCVYKKLGARASGKMQMRVSPEIVVKYVGGVVLGLSEKRSEGNSQRPLT